MIPNSRIRRRRPQMGWFVIADQCNMTPEEAEHMANNYTPPPEPPLPKAAWLR